MNECSIELKSVHQFYKGGKLHVLKDISLNIKKGSMTSIIGPSGSGKTTLLSIMGLLSRPSKGSVSLLSEQLSGESDDVQSKFRNEKIGFIFQNYHLIKEFSALYNVMLPALLKSGDEKKIKQKANGLMQDMGLSKRMHHYPSELSGGEQQRVCLCRALINSPLIILADEPTGNLDSENAGLVFDMMKRSQEHYKTTIVIITHNNDLAKQTDQIFHLVDGQILN